MNTISERIEVIANSLNFSLVMQRQIQISTIGMATAALESFRVTARLIKNTTCSTRLFVRVGFSSVSLVASANTGKASKSGI